MLLTKIQNSYSVIERGVSPNEYQDMTEKLQTIINEAGEGDTIRFPKGTYFLSSPLKISKKSLRLCGEEALLLHIGFDPWNKEFQEKTGFFDIDGSSQLTIEGFQLDFKQDTAVSGVVEMVDLEESSLVIRLYEEYDWITGEECYLSLHSFDTTGEPNYHLASCSGILERKKIGACLLKIRYQYIQQLEKVSVGEYVNIRLSMNGSPAVKMRNSSDICFRDVSVYQSVANVFYIAPRCCNVLFERVRIEIKPGRRQFMSSNADGIHITGLLGKIEIRDCYFQALGDDALNIHSRAGIVTSCDKAFDTLEFIDGWKKEAVEDVWCSAGDCIYVYDPKTFLKKAEMTVNYLEGMQLSVAALPSNIEEGDILCNTAFFAAVEVYRTTVCYGRARAFLLQTENVIIEDCNLYNMCLPAILMSPDIVHWYEVGPCKNVVIRNNRIHHCGHIVAGGVGCITAKACHDFQTSQYPAGVHQQIRIENNVITDAGCAGIYISTTDGVVIQNNKIFPQYTNGFSLQKPEEKERVILENCTNITCDMK